MFNLKTQEWSMPQIKLQKTWCNFKIVQHEGKVYVFGGYSYFNQQNDSVEVMDFAA